MIRFYVSLHLVAASGAALPCQSVVIMLCVDLLNFFIAVGEAIALLTASLRLVQTYGEIIPPADRVANVRAVFNLALNAWVVCDCDGYLT